MEALISHFSLLSDHALADKTFDPSTIEDLMKLFEIESYRSWAAMELDADTELEEAENSLVEAEKYLESEMERAMDEFRRFEEEMERESEKQMKGLVDTAERARMMGKLMEKAATVASKRYIEAAVSSATATVRSAFRGVNSKKVHPS